MSGLSQLVEPKERARFPKSARLLKNKDFKFKKYKKIRDSYFHILVAESGNSRLGISIAKKVLKRSVWRNRVRRLIKEAYRTRQTELKGKDLHVIAQPELLKDWEKLKVTDIEKCLMKAAI